MMYFATSTPILVSAMMLQDAGALHVHGSISIPPRETVFISKFCFDNTGENTGLYQYEFSKISPEPGAFQLAWFDDEASSYPDESAFHDWSCNSRRLTEAARALITVNASHRSYSGPLAISEVLRPRWWYLAVVECSGVERKFDYSVLMTNPSRGWQQQFSMDESGIESNIIFFIAYLVVAIIQIGAIRTRSETAKTDHPLRLILSTATATASLGTLALAINAIMFSRNGERNEVLEWTGKLFKSYSKMALAAMLLLFSRGICISEPLRTKHLLQASRLVLPLIVASFGLERWGEISQSRTYTTAFVYRTPFGATIVSFDICLLVFYMKNLFVSYTGELHSHKKLLVRFLGIVCSLAFAVLPCSVLLGSVLDPWVRVRILFILTNSVHIGILALLVIGLWPERTQSIFCLDQVDLAKMLGSSCDPLSKDDDSLPY